MGVYKYDLAELTSVSSGLATLKGDYENASRDRGNADSAFGYPDLQRAMRDFVDNWKHERDKQLEAIEGAGGALKKIIENYEKYDADSAEELREGCQP